MDGQESGSDLGRDREEEKSQSNVVEVRKTQAQRAVHGDLRIDDARDDRLGSLWKRREAARQIFSAVVQPRCHPP